MESTSLSHRCRTALLAAAVVAAGVGADLARAAWDEPGRGGAGQDFSGGGDPTVGTLPMRTGGVDDVAGPDQTIYLFGDATRLRTALAGARFDWAPGEFAIGIWPLPAGQAWVELHGRFDVVWDDPSALAGIELGVGSGFEGGGLVCAVESASGISSPTVVGVGRSIPIGLPRLHDAGLLPGPVILHGLHVNGARTRVELEGAGGHLTLRQRL